MMFGTVAYSGNAGSIESGLLRQALDFLAEMERAGHHAGPIICNPNPTSRSLREPNSHAQT